MANQSAAGGIIESIRPKCQICHFRDEDNICKLNLKCWEEYIKKLRPNIG